MTREIKYRAWDGTRMIHFSNPMIGIGKGYLPNKTKTIRDKEPYVYFADDDFNGHVKLGKHEIMQYTGLKGDNGKEIYEGDICPFVYDHIGNIWLLIVEWDASNARFVLKGNGSVIGLDEFEGNVLGNIYENPELLK